MAIPGGYMDRAIQARKQQPGYNPNILGPFGSLITGVGNLLQGKPYGTSFTGVGNIPPSARGESYRDAELRLGNRGGSGGNAGYSVTPFRPIGGTPAERAQAAETSRIAQLTAQDPELKRYEQARQLAVAPGATPQQVQSAEDIGMQIWAQKYGKTLAPKVKPGQSGYDAIQGVLNAGAMGTPMDLPFDTKNVLGGKPMPEGLSYGTTAPTAIPGGTPIKGGGFPEGQAAMFQRFMQGPATAVPTFQGSPLGTTPQLNALNYGGAVQPLGTAVSDDFYKTEEAKELAAMFANYRLGQ